MFEYTQNRELSWLKFNQRVLEEADNKNIPILERLKFFQIFISNLDEFFMIRVGGLAYILSMQQEILDSRTGMSINEQLLAIYSTVSELYKQKDIVYKDLVSDLKNNGINFSSYKNLDESAKKYCKSVFKNEIAPILSPQIIDINHPFPHLESGISYVVVLLSKKEKETIGLVPVTDHIKKYIQVDNSTYVFSEKLVYDQIESVFKNYKVLHKNIINITRNADINFEESEMDEEWDFRDIMKDLLKKRKRLQPVRIESFKELEPKVQTILFKKLELDPNQHFVSKTPLKFSYIFDLINTIKNNKELSYPPLIQKDYLDIVGNNSVMSYVYKKDLLLYYPFDSMQPFLRLIKEAANDKFVTSIKITIYRLSQKSRLVDYLCQAAENGKDVMVLIELRARFDELNNIDFSEKLEDAGCKVMYGFDEYKVHSKLCLITRKIGDKISYITQVGTGNYNEKTSAIYTDYSVITSDLGIGYDALMFFQNMLLGNVDYVYDNLLVAPLGLKSKLLNMIEEETLKGSEGYIFLKLNSITDVDVIEALAKASQNNVCIKMIVRGICCIVPGVKGFTDNIEIHSIVGRFLEHSRIYLFGKENPKIYISSADMMSRNTKRRVEVAVPILKPEIKSIILTHIDLLLTDNVNGRILTSNKTNVKFKTDGVLIDNHKILQIKEPILVKKPVNTFKRNLTKLIKDNNIAYELNYRVVSENHNTLFDYKINNNLIKIIEVKSVISAQNMLQKWLFISKCLELEGYNLIVAVKNDNFKMVNKFSLLQLDAYNISNIGSLIPKIKQ